ncbi:MAG TPA: molybdopterin molybdotransferase MoeA [Cyclobacteriaceae bacterium]
MVSVSEATSIVRSHLFKPKAEMVSITNALGRVLAEPITADLDFPPFDRVAMDGIAIQYEQFANGQKEFEVEGVAAAGSPQKELSDKTRSMEVMTGAPLPLNTNVVIRYEDLEIKENKAIILIPSLINGQNIHQQGQDAKQGQLLLPISTLISPAEVALIASVGKSQIKVNMLPRTAVISTGDELVDINDIPEPHQIRKSNSYTLQAALKSRSCDSTIYHLPDRQDLIEDELRTILAKNDLLILSGGVSKGKFDFVSVALEKLGVKKLFHKVKQKPGKPFWFGSIGNKTVFALPGNPVSTYMCFYRYIDLWLKLSLGLEVNYEKASLTEDYEFLGDLTYFLQVSISNQEGHLMASPVPGGGSGDFANLKDVNAFMELPEDKKLFKRGEVFPILYLRER